MGAPLKSRSAVSPPKSYVEIEILSSDRNNLNSKSLTDIMRALDSYRMHSPIESECTLLNIPRDRLCCESLKDILCLAGACSVVRFESDVLQKLTSLSGNVQVSYKAVSDTFGALSLEEKKYVYISSNSSPEKIESFIAKANEFSVIIMELQSIISSKRSTISQGKISYSFSSKSIFNVVIKILYPSCYYFNPLPFYLLFVLNLNRSQNES